MYVPGFDNLWDEVLREAHDCLLSIHPGSTKMYTNLKTLYLCPRLKMDCVEYISECDVCRRVKAVHQKPGGLLQPLKTPEWKWEGVEMDFITRLPRSQKGNDVIFVVIDRLTKVANFLPVKETISAFQLTELYRMRIVLLYGVPQFISSDHGSIFTSKFWCYGNKDPVQHLLPYTLSRTHGKNKSNPVGYALSTCHLFRH